MTAFDLTKYLNTTYRDSAQREHETLGKYSSDPEVQKLRSQLLLLEVAIQRTVLYVLDSGIVNPESETVIARADLEEFERIADERSKMIKKAWEAVEPFLENGETWPLYNFAYEVSQLPESMGD